MDVDSAVKFSIDIINKTCKFINFSLSIFTNIILEWLVRDKSVN